MVQLSIIDTIAVAKAAEQRTPKLSPIILYDGECGVCSRFVIFVLEKEAGSEIRFASLSSPVGQEIRRSSKISPDVDSIVLVVDGRALIYSDAVLETCARLRYPWKIATVLRIVPRALRDWIYRLVAAHRSQVPSPKCRLVLPEERSRFLDLDT